MKNYRLISLATSQQRNYRNMSFDVEFGGLT